MDIKVSCNTLRTRWISRWIDITHVMIMSVFHLYIHHWNETSDGRREIEDQYRCKNNNKYLTCNLKIGHLCCIVKQALLMA